jgi:hypothetical protein
VFINNAQNSKTCDVLIRCLLLGAGLACHTYGSLKKIAACQIPGYVPPLTLIEDHLYIAYYINQPSILRCIKASNE